MKGKTVAVLSVFVLLSILAVAGSAEAAVVYVNRNAALLKKGVPNGTSWKYAFHAVREGINTAVAGDEVWVAQGTYYENIVMKDGAALYGGFGGVETARNQRNWKTYVTILDGNQMGSVIVMGNCSSSATRIDGFTIRNGSGTPGSGGGQLFGGGIYSSGSAGTVENNNITGNNANQGGGIACYGSGSTTIIKNAISGNTAIGGGGVFIENRDDSSFISLLYNVIDNNRTAGDPTHEVGGGIYCAFSSHLIKGNIISFNTTSNSGGGIALQYGSQVLINNIIEANSSSWMGGGIYADQSAAEITNNNIIGNTSYGGGGIQTYYGYYSTGLPVVTNNIVAFNSSGITTSDSGNITLIHNDVFGNTSYDYSGVAPGIGDISVDPLFVNYAAGDYHLQPTSPCINSGYTIAVDNTWVDMDGEPRVNMTDGIAIIDIGADEYYPDTTPPAVTITDPTNGATGVPISKTITVTFSEAIRIVPPDANIVLYDENRHLVVGKTMSVSGNILTISPSSALMRNTLYSVSIPVFSIQDMAGNDMAVDKVFFFTTGSK